MNRRFIHSPIYADDDSLNGYSWIKNELKMTYNYRLLKPICFFIFYNFSVIIGNAQSEKTKLEYLVTIKDPSSHLYEVQLHCTQGYNDTIYMHMPQWMPGYYQILDYAKSVENVVASDENGNSVRINKIDENTWAVLNLKGHSFYLNYTIRTNKQFVANSYVDADHAYIIPENTFLYAEAWLHTPVSVVLQFPSEWNIVATGLDKVVNVANQYIASDFDILYDCPLLIGNLEELPSFEVSGIKHRFVGYQLGDFDKVQFMDNLKRIVQSAVDIIGDIPYTSYTFIGIGPGRGGIEHLNNTTISFDGNQLSSPDEMNKTMNFIAHEYFHHYNVKRIRPFELGPFDYDQGNRTNLLWVSEGLTVYYEYLILKRAGLVDLATLLGFFEHDLHAVENNPGRYHQSLQQASYNTWSDGPFGTQNIEPGHSISYYDKGPIVGLFLDFEIRNATENKKSLDDVMRLLYWKYYKGEQRGFTEAEFQHSCELVAGKSLTEIFEYVYTTKVLDYERYLSLAGLNIEISNVKTLENDSTKILKLKLIKGGSEVQLKMLNSWMKNITSE